ncbi:DNA-binding transcriptional LysR family regulator [Sphingomonas naasensis]|uniref:LysR family transcriptional regulator n=1 Tax=Sphingomonas naasensis TaxID=1344951 RepID=A0A4S1WN52_9SPHN|nr:LysR family transcriptional regulator [Sphingomonas naasensis]NIJ21050.1 DNA-binding transcriptional LysR family regulator [Sphingomonas naasensis]TGX43427.1 LysR family transcriptional regulator [Sphingomonas naasensis]
MLNEIDLSRADLNLLVLFEAVFDEAHVGRAADRLRLSPSAVSHGLGRLRRLLNDPVFLKTPRGVVPSDRARALAPLVADILQRVRGVVAHAAPFDPASSTRRMTIGAPDGVSAVFLQPLLADLAERAPGIAIGIRQLLPAPEEAVDRAWRGAFADLESGTLDIAVIPAAEAPLRFERRTLYEEDFVLVMRPGHPFASAPGVDQYCASQHLVVSLSGDPHGFVDDVLAREGLSRRVALTVPNFMFACAIVPDTGLLCAVPRRFAARYAPRFGLAIHDAPLPLGHFRLNAFVPKPALMDAGTLWLLDRLGEVGARIGTTAA